MSTTGVMRQISPPSSGSGGGGAGGASGGSGNAPADDSPDVEVRKADQEMINEFGRLNNKYIELDEDLTGLKVRASWGGRGGRRLAGAERCGRVHVPPPFFISSLTVAVRRPLALFYYPLALP